MTTSQADDWRISERSKTKLRWRRWNFKQWDFAEEATVGVNHLSHEPLDPDILVNKVEQCSAGSVGDIIDRLVGFGALEETHEDQ